MNVFGMQPAFFQGAQPGFGMTHMAVPSAPAFGAAPMGMQPSNAGLSPFSSQGGGGGNVYDQMFQMMGFMSMFVMGMMAIIMQMMMRMTSGTGMMPGLPGTSTSSGNPGSSSSASGNPGRSSSAGNPGSGVPVSNPGGSSPANPSAGFNGGGRPAGGATGSMQRLADIASRTGGALNSQGWCLKGVQTSLRNFGVTLPPMGSAYKAAAYMDGRPETFERVNVSRREDLRNLPPGHIVVYDRGHGSGAGFEHGHIYITAGNGVGYSDHRENIFLPRDGQKFSVFKVKEGATQAA